MQKQVINCTCCHPREGGDPGLLVDSCSSKGWIPAFRLRPGGYDGQVAGMTFCSLFATLITTNQQRSQIRFLLWFTCCAFVTTYATQEFVIAPKAELKKKMSAGALKEQIGKVTKQAFDQTTVLVHELGDLGCCLSTQQQCASCAFAVGTMQKDIASLQKKYSSIVEKLVENDKPFKKTSRANLKKTNDVLVHAQQQLTRCAKEVARVRAEFKKTEVVSAAALQKHAQCLHKQHTVLNGLLGAMAADECLKTT